MALKLTYMAVRARAECSRMMLAYGDVSYEFVNHKTRAAIAEAKALKNAAGRRLLTWGQLPVLEVGDSGSFTQSGTLVRYVAKLVGLYPSDPFKVRHNPAHHTALHRDHGSRRNACSVRSLLMCCVSICYDSVPS